MITAQENDKLIYFGSHFFFKNRILKNLNKNNVII